MGDPKGVVLPRLLFSFGVDNVSVLTFTVTVASVLAPALSSVLEM